MLTDKELFIDNLMSNITVGEIEDEVYQNLAVVHVSNGFDFKESLISILAQYTKENLSIYQTLIIHLILMLIMQGKVLRIPTHSLLGMIGSENECNASTREKLISRLVDKYLISFSEYQYLFQEVTPTDEYVTFISSDMSDYNKKMMRAVCSDILGDIFFRVLYVDSNLDMEHYYIILENLLESNYINVYKILCEQSTKYSNRQSLNALLESLNLFNMRKQFVDGCSELVMLSHDTKYTISTTQCSRDTYLYLCE